MNETLPADLHELLQTVDTPTVCNALGVLEPQLRGRGYTSERVIPADASLKPIVGFARTARIVSSQPSPDAPEVIRQRRFDYYRYVSSGPRPVVAVMQDCGPHPGYGCIWGGINVALHQGLGVAGAITNGAIRDLGELSPGFQLLGGNVCPGAGFAHIVDFDTPVTVFGLAVTPGDLLHADRHGAVIIPTALLPRLYGAIGFVLRREDVLLQAARQGGFDFDALVRAWEAFESIKMSQPEPPP
jgi:regulator of RNase E activity RraA